jgi:HEPN domain-containing protein
MVDPQVVTEWVTKANEDFEFARVNLEEGKPFFSQICFHFHQAAEKYLKAFIVANDLEFKKIHDLPILLKLCTAKQSELNSIMEGCKFLNRFYVDTRYPVHWPTHYTKEETAEARTAADKIRLKILDTLKSLLPNLESSLS